MSDVQLATVATATPLAVRQRATGQSVPAVVLDGSGYVPVVGDRVVGSMFVGNRFTILGSLTAREKPGARIQATGQVMTQTSGNVAVTGLSLDYSRGGMIVTAAAGKITVPIAGRYLIAALLVYQVSAASPPAGNYECQVWRNGSQSAGRTRSTGYAGTHGYPSPLVVDTIKLMANDYLNLHSDETGGHVGIGYNADHPIWMAVEWLHA